MAGPAIAVPPPPVFLHQLITQLRRRGLLLGIDDVDALRQALAAGFGWSSEGSLLNVCLALWAKSPSEAAIIRACFARVDAPVWTAPEAGRPNPRRVAVIDRPVAGDEPSPAAGDAADIAAADPPAATPAADPVPVTRQIRGSTAMPPATGRHDATLITDQQYPLTARQIAQAWRGLRRPRRGGPATELDVAGTLNRYALTGVPTPPVLVQRRRNSARLLLLIDRQGSMTPFHHYVDHCLRAVVSSARLDAITIAYFHNTAGYSADKRLIATMADPFDPSVDPILPGIAALAEGRLYDDDALTRPRWLSSVLGSLHAETGVVVISDAGAARGRLITERLVDTVALLKAAKREGRLLAWLNPMPSRSWHGTTAGQLARHVPMYGLTREGMYRAVDALRGRPVGLERPL
ncbi:VWA domain-containing protein [Actinoplanes sp. NPDC026623]|uniref:VWA domain-containing protein n=1 Tax=Actinoplanes sp. NPDC026623 TaxID=3155610 RepID=UPI0033D74549